MSSAQRHGGDDAAIFVKRATVYAQARANLPPRGNGNIYNRLLPKEVRLSRQLSNRSHISPSLFLRRVRLGDRRASTSPFRQLAPLRRNQALPC